jgi:tetratricopeptide (TPR) repeat protein
MYRIGASRTFGAAAPPALAALALWGLLAGAGCRSAEAAREHEREAAQHIQAGRTPEAVASLEAALEEDPGSAQAALSLATLYESAGDASRAVAVLRGVVDARPSLYLVRMSLANLLTRLGRLEEALAHFRVVGQGAQSAAAYLGMADIFEARGEMSGCERALIAALQVEPSNPAPRWRLARLYDTLRHPEARNAWERYTGVATGNPEERSRLDEAAARLRVLAAALDPAEQAAVLATVRRQLAILRPGPGGQVPRLELTAIAVDAGPKELRRFYSGRFHLALRAPGAPTVRGSGAGATLYEGAVSAAEDLRRSRVFDLYYATALSRARLEVFLEVGEPAVLAVVEGAAPDDVAPLEGGAFAEDEALEWRDGARTLVVLPTDRAAQGLATLRATLAWAAAEAGLPAEDWRKGALRRASVKGFMEDEPREGEGGRTLVDGEGASGAGIGRAAPVDVDGVLPSPPPLGRRSALVAASGGAAWILSLLGPEGAIPSAYDPASGALATPTARAQAAAIEALAAAAAASGDARFSDGAAIARRWLAVEEMRAAGAAATLPGSVAGAAGHAHHGGPAGAAATSAPAHGAPGATPLAPVPAPIAGPGVSGAAGLAREIEAALEALARETASAPRNGVGPNVDAWKARVGAAERRLGETVREALRLSIDPCAAGLYADRTRVRGAFREGRLDPHVTLEGTARLVTALLRAAPHLSAGTGDAAK